MAGIKLELLQYSYLEHFKEARDLALVLRLNHPKRKAIEKELSSMLKQIQKLKKNG